MKAVWVLEGKGGGMEAARKISNLKSAVKTNGTIAYSYVCQIKCIVSQAFDYACDREIMGWNFMRKAKVNEDKCKEPEDRELGVWEDDEIKTLQTGSMKCWNGCRKYRNSPALFIL